MKEAKQINIIDSISPQIGLIGSKSLIQFLL